MEIKTKLNKWDLIKLKKCLLGKVKESEVAHLCPTLCDPMDCM